jgi:hypothetical protein
MGEPQGDGEPGGDMTTVLKTYACYRRCERCGVYDRDAGWCELCGKPKRAARNFSGAGQASANRSNAAETGARRAPSRPVAPTGSGTTGSGRLTRSMP